MNLEIGTKIRWEASNGVIRGIIKNIVLAPAANNKVTPWIDVEYVLLNDVTGTKHTSTVRLCATDSNLKMMQVFPVGSIKTTG